MEKGPSVNQNLQEILRYPVFIRERTLAETLDQIGKVPPEKRRIIVYAGVHPNEGTAELSKKYAQEWAKKYNALVVCQPTEETPHGIWKKRESLIDTNGVVPPLPKDLELNEDVYEEAFSLGERTLFVQFHGTPIAQWQHMHDKERKPKLEIILPITQAPELQGLESLPDARVEKDQTATYKKWRPQEPETVLVEYYYKGESVPVIDPYFQKILTQEKSKGPRLLSFTNWDRQMNIGPEYLEQHTPTDEDKKAFDEVFEKRFEEILRHISEKLTENH